MTRWSALVAAALLLAGPALAGEPEPDFFAQAAREMAKVARKAHVRYVSVRSFTAANGGGSGAIGAGAAEKLVAALIHEDGPRVLHATLHDDLPDAFVSGSYLPIGSGVQVTVTMTSAASGRPLYTRWKVVPNEWGADGPRLGAGVKRREAGPADEPVRMDDDVQARSCSNWERRADALQRAVLLPKARYWAQRYWGLAPGKTFAADPARLITSRELAREFQRSLRFWIGQRDVPKLSAEEARSLVGADLRTEELLERCAPERGSVVRR